MKILICRIWFILSLISCSSTKYLVVDSYPSKANVYVKGVEDVPHQKIKIGQTPLKKSKIRYTNKNGKVKSLDVDDLSDENFFIIVEKKNYEAKSLLAPPLAHQVELNPEPGVEVAKKILQEKEVKEEVVLRITSNPSGAKVYIDGNMVGNTPYNFQGKKGKYKLMLKQAHHVTQKESFELTSQGPFNLHFDLPKKAVAASK